ncbi:hypothetical protein ACFPER_01325 [Agromyces aurantiacus]|uniref:ABC transporter n=1 Tax=Agromyces aurantiacus TaxID=165814 RepID=A0ABV9R216_9MICO|nr:hypothetical protein [Agromyces aurantiacus]MBM7505727.1 hypothetical protein [Agromyces aurantiacus]
MSSTTPGSEPERRDADGDGVPDEPLEAQRSVDPTAPDADRVDRLEPPEPAPSELAGEPPQEAAFTGTEEAAPAAAEGDTVVHDRSELDAAVERARTEHPPVVAESPDAADRTDTTAMQRDDLVAASPEPVRAAEVRRETGVPETIGAAGAVGAAATTAPPAAPTPPAPQTVYVQAPPAPRMRGNRGFGVLVGLIATALFGLLYAGISYLVILAQNTPAEAVRVFGQFAAQPVFWIPVVFFFLAFAVLAIILNRAAWWAWAVFGLIVGIVVYFSYIGGALLTVAAWQFTPGQAADFLRERWLDPFAIIAFIVARELPIWFGGWIAAHGRTVTERNRVAREEYERQLAAGPQPVSTR